MPAQEAVQLLTRHRWREGDVELLEAAGSNAGGSPGARLARDPWPEARRLLRDYPNLAGVGLPVRAAMTLHAEHVLALGTGALLLGCLSLLNGLNSIVMWTLRLIAWFMLAAAVLTA